MTMRFKELCMDTTGGGALGQFWASVLGLDYRPDGGPGDVIGAAEYQGIAMCPVPEAKTVKHRVHFDVYGDAASFEALGASIDPASRGFPWTVLRDPEGGEFCAFEKDPLPPYRLHGIAVDSVDPERIANWWGQRFSVEPKRFESPDGEVVWELQGVTDDPVLTFDFVKVPEPKTVKNRIHWDVYGEAAEVEAAGATRLWDTPHWITLADPEGNEFCVFPQ